MKKQATIKIKDGKGEKRIEDLINPNNFRISIFGSARTKKNEKTYKQVYEFAKEMGKNGIDVVTGGGPGVMEAASSGHEAGDTSNKAQSIGFTIELPFEAESNEYLEVEQHFMHFSSRLDHFMAISHAVVIMPGGIGTNLELFYTWQLTQVKHINKIPIILVGEMWEKLIDWMKEYQLKPGLISPQDMDNVYIAKNNKEAIKIILDKYDEYKKMGEGSLAKNLEKYKID
jgi:hypothetical protein